MIKILIEIIILSLIKIIKKKKIKIQIKKKIYIKKGKYLTFLGNCISCHTLNGGKPFSGGYSLKTIFGIINTPNITSNKKYGIGKVKLNDFINILRNGISKNKKFLFPIFPYVNYCKIKKKDIKNIFIFLKNTKNEEILNKKNKIKFPIKYKKIMIGWRILFFKKLNFKKKKKKSNIKRGNYLSKSLAHCDMCHTKINNIGKINKYFKYKGKSIIEKWKSTEISNKTTGIKNKKINDLRKILKEGFSKNKIINGVMADVVQNSLQYVNIIDVLSISKYIKNKINNKKFEKIKNKKNIINNRIKYEKGRIIYKKKCIQCHGKINLGNYPIYPKIINKKNDIDGINNLKNIFKKINLINTIKNKYVSIMPLFTEIKKNLIKKYIKINKNLRKS